MPSFFFVLLEIKDEKVCKLLVCINFIVILIKHKYNIEVSVKSSEFVDKFFLISSVLNFHTVYKFKKCSEAFWAGVIQNMYYTVTIWWSAILGFGLQPWHFCRGFCFAIILRGTIQCQKQTR